MGFPGVGIVFQDADNQIIASTVMGEVSFGPMNLGLPESEVAARVDEALAYMNISDFKKRAPHYCSGGEKKRITIADIIAMHSEVIVFDEPTAMLDPNGRREVMATIRRLNREKGMTVLHITHYMAELVDADRIIVMDEGQKIMEGPPREVFARVEGLKKIGLDVPPMTELAHGLRADGFDVPADVLKIDEMVDALCR